MNNLKLLNHENLVETFVNCNLLNEKHNYDAIIFHIKSSTCKKSAAEKTTKAVERWLNWANNKSYVKVVSATIPDGILPHGTSGALTDVRVFTRHGPDDKIYDKYEDVRKKLARGNCFLEFTDSNHTTNSECVIYAMKKFTGGLYDDDDRGTGDNSSWKNYFTKPIEKGKTVTSLRKINGEAAHVSVRYIHNQFFICAGSKNVHLLFRNEDHIDRYSDSRYLVARQVCHTIWNFLSDISEEQKLRFLSFLHYTQFTAIFEILQPTSMHIEDLSYLEKSRLVFITWTSNDVENESQLCCMPPDIAVEIAKSLGLFTVDYNIFPISEVEDHMLKVRESYGYEGEVFYFQDENGEVIGLLKKKTVWYVIIRAIREKIKNASREITNHTSFSVNEHGNKIEKRINEIQKWLQFDNDCKKKWQELGVSFLKWCHYSFKTGKFTKNDLNTVFPTLWNKFLEEGKRSDHIPVKCELTTYQEN